MSSARGRKAPAQGRESYSQFAQCALQTCLVRVSLCLAQSPAQVLPLAGPRFFVASVLRELRLPEVVMLVHTRPRRKIDASLFSGILPLRDKEGFRESSRGYGRHRLCRILAPLRKTASPPQPSWPSLPAYRGPGAAALIPEEEATRARERPRKRPVEGRGSRTRGRKRDPPNRGRKPWWERIARICWPKA